MQDSHPAAAQPGGESSAPAPHFAGGHAAPQRLTIEFTGSGSEYFRIWIVNLLLTIVTLSFYRPFAKARRLAYFHGNTLVGGQPLGFHGNPWKMLRGYLLMLLFAVAYGVGSRLSPMAALVALGSFALLWPALWRASLQFRLANTSWRGLRLAFTGDLRGAYVAMIPGVLPWLGFIAASVLMQPGDAEGAAHAAPPTTAMVALGLSFVAMLALLPWSLALVKRYQHGHYAYAAQRSQLDASVGSFYVFALKCLLIGVAIMVVTGLAMWLGFRAAGEGAVPSLWIMLLPLISYGLFFLVLMPFGQSRLQNLVWGSTRSQSLRWHSELKMLPLGLLTLKNLLLVLVTLGFYWPFAAVATARMRLQAVSLELDGDPALWQAGQTSGQNEATGDAAGDLFGIDMGL
jgi:uncharacterized membrane protein YjgN (DUF898 family)